MPKTLNFINIILIAQLFIFKLSAMEINQDNKLIRTANTNIDNLCPDLFNEMISYLIPDKFPDNKKDFKEKYYNNIRNLKLVNKKLKNSLTELGVNEILNKFEDHLLNIIDSKDRISLYDKVNLAVEIGSLKFFIDNETKILAHKAFRNDQITKSIKNNFPEITKLIFNKFILKNLEYMEDSEIKNLDKTLNKYNNQEFIKKLNRQKIIWNIKRKSLLPIISLVYIFYFIILYENNFFPGFIISIFAPFLHVMLISNISTLTSKKYCLDGSDLLLGTLISLSLIITSVFLFSKSFLNAVDIKNQNLEKAFLDGTGFCNAKKISQY